MKRFRRITGTLLSSVVLAVWPPAGTADALPAECADPVTDVSFGLHSALYPGTSLSVSFFSSHLFVPFEIHGFGQVTTQSPLAQPPVMTIPRTAAVGRHHVRVFQCGVQIAEHHAYVNQFTPWATPSSSFARVGQRLTWEAHRFMPGELVRLHVNGVASAVQTRVHSEFDAHHGIDHQGEIPAGSLRYTIPSKFAGTTVLFELRGTSSSKSAKTWVTIAK